MYFTKPFRNMQIPENIVKKAKKPTKAGKKLSISSPFSGVINIANIKIAIPHSSLLNPFFKVTLEGSTGFIDSISDLLLLFSRTCLKYIQV